MNSKNFRFCNHKFLKALQNITGYGIDNHLCALHLLAKEEVKDGLLTKMPDLFLDPTWTETMRFPLSTSQVCQLCLIMCGCLLVK